MALRELDRVDYAILRTLELTNKDHRKLEYEKTITDPTLRPIQILLSGFSESKDVRRELMDGIKKSVNAADAALGAYATAYIQNVGSPAVLELSRDYVADSSLPNDSRELIVEAFAIHSVSSGTQIGLAIQDAIATLVKTDPSVARMIVRQFGKRMIGVKPKAYRNCSRVVRDVRCSISLR